MSKNVRNLSARKGLEDNLFERIAETFDENTGLDTQAQSELADQFLVGNANVFGAASFYDFLKPENAGKKAFACTGSACLLAGTQDAVREKLGEHFKPSQIGDVYCLGRCHENSAFHIQDHNHSGADINRLTDIIDNPATASVPDRYNVGAVGPALLTTNAPNEQQALEALVAVLDSSRDTLMEEMQVSGLRGRGGAGFPTAIKLAAVRNETNDTKYIVCNADEGDPGAFSDRYLLEQRPHLVLFGMAMAGFLTGAREGVVYIRAEYPEAITITEKCAEAFNALFPFQRSDGETVQYKLYVMKARGAYICGEETALLSSIEGLRPEVRTRPPFPVQSGLYGKPTVVSNVETLANLYAIATGGGAAFKAIGTGKSSGTKLLSLDSHFANPGIYEAAMGTPLDEVLYGLGGGFRKPVKALHIGGPLGGLVPLHKTKDLTVDFESFASNGFLLGHASVLSIPEAFPLVEYLEHLFAFTAHESCGKCFPCRIGSVRGKELLEGARKQQRRIDRELFADLLETLEKGSLCALGGGLPLPVKNAMKYFDEELKAFFTPQATAHNV